MSVRVGMFLKQASIKKGFVSKIINAWLRLQSIFVKIRKFLIKVKIKRAKHNWFISKNSNFYNPILEATVYKWGSSWSIARYGNYFGAFDSKEDAMNEIFEIWLDDERLKCKRFDEIAGELEYELKNSCPKILNESKYKQSITKLKPHDFEQHVQEINNDTLLYNKGLQENKDVPEQHSTFKKNMAIPSICLILALMLIISPRVCITILIAVFFIMCLPKK